MIRQLKKSIVPVLLLIRSVSCFGQFTHDIRYGIKPKGKIRSYTINQTNVDDTLFKNISSIDYHDYNKKGQLIKSWKASTLNEQDLNTRYVDSFAYNKKGNLTKVIYYDSNGAPNRTDNYVYSHLRRFIKIKTQLYNGDTSRFSEQFKINASGKILSSYRYGSKTDTSVMLLETTTDYKYNTLGCRIEEIVYDSHGNKTSKRINEYNSYGDLTRFTYEEDSLFDGAFNYTVYDSHNNWTSSLLFRFGKPAARFKRRITYYK